MEISGKTFIVTGGASGLGRATAEAILAAGGNAVLLDVNAETGRAAERPLVAAVFVNRLRVGMKLQTDPTVIYGIPNFNGNLTRKDLARPTPFNTYTNTGLTLGPIANPGARSIVAALNPAPANYLFFVSKNDGTHEFSATIGEHNRAVEQYQKRGPRQPPRKAA